VCLRPLFPIDVGICELVIFVRKDAWEQVNMCVARRPGLVEIRIDILYIHKQKIARRFVAA
jgi:hypothetical protein